MRRALALLALLIAAPLQAETVTSPAPDAVAVTVYRAPDRDADQEIDLGWLQGYALVTETRTVRIPEGRGTIRFEGVAQGMLPESAIIAGLPDGVREKNLDADLLSPISLYARSTGRPVTIRRQDAKGNWREEPAIIRSGGAGPAILQTRQGFQAVNCGREFEEIAYQALPDGLSAKPTLSIETESTQGGMAQITLSYLAWGFDWQANYVATMRADGQGADLVAWVTLANGDSVSFPDASTAVVAGKIERGAREYQGNDAGAEFEFTCFEEGEDSYGAAGIVEPVPPPPPMMAAPVPAMEMADNIVVTGSRVQRVVQEELGDLKLYRVPFPTTVAAQAMKQVSLMARERIPVRIVHTATFDMDGDATEQGVELRAKNVEKDRLGLPLPAGPFALFEPKQGRPMLIGEGVMEDKAIGEDVEIKVDTESSWQVQIESDSLDTGSGTGAQKGVRWDDKEITVSNALPYPISFEGEFALYDGQSIEKPGKGLKFKDGKWVWDARVPANGTIKLRYRALERFE